MMDGSRHRSHYEALGVSPSAGIGQIRDAHRQMARVLHPDRHSESSPAERRFAEARMREVNAAWYVLSDTRRRAEYDRALSAERDEATSANDEVRSSDLSTAGPVLDPDGEQNGDGGGFYVDDEEVPEWQYHMVRRGPIIVVLIVAAILFVLTAYAGSGRNADPSDSSKSVTTAEASRDCVRITTEGRSAVLVPCTETNDGHVVTKVNAALECPESTTYVVVDSEFLCVSSDPAVVGSGNAGD